MNCNYAWKTFPHFFRSRLSLRLIDRIVAAFALPLNLNSVSIKFTGIRIDYNFIIETIHFSPPFRSVFIAGCNPCIDNSSRFTFSTSFGGRFFSLLPSLSLSTLLRWFFCSSAVWCAKGSSVERMHKHWMGCAGGRFALENQSMLCNGICVSISKIQHFFSGSSQRNEIFFLSVFFLTGNDFS